MLLEVGVCYDQCVLLAKLLTFDLLHFVIQVYVPTSNAEEAEVEQFYEDLQDLLELTPKKLSFSL